MCLLTLSVFYCNEQKGLAFAYDPDGYSVEIIKRGGIDFGDAKVAEK